MDCRGLGVGALKGLIVAGAAGRGEGARVEGQGQALRFGSEMMAPVAIVG